MNDHHITSFRDLKEEISQLDWYHKLWLICVAADVLLAILGTKLWWIPTTIYVGGSLILPCIIVIFQGKIKKIPGAFKQAAKIAWEKAKRRK